MLGLRFLAVYWHDRVGCVFDVRWVARLFQLSLTDQGRLGHRERVEQATSTTGHSILVEGRARPDTAAIFAAMDDLAARRAAYVSRLEAAVPRIVARLSALPEVRRISIFGSFARGRRDLFTDLDVLVVLDTDESVPQRLARLYSLVDSGVDLDLLAWTPAEYDAMRRRPFGRSITAEEQVLYEA